MICETITAARLDELYRPGTYLPILTRFDEAGRPVFWMTGPALSLAAIVFTDTPIADITLLTDRSKWTTLSMVLIPNDEPPPAAEPIASPALTAILNELVAAHHPAIP